MLGSAPGVGDTPPADTVAGWFASARRDRHSQADLLADQLQEFDALLVYDVALRQGRNEVGRVAFHTHLPSFFTEDGVFDGAQWLQDLVQLNILRPLSTALQNHINKAFPAAPRKRYKAEMSMPQATPAPAPNHDD